MSTETECVLMSLTAAELDDAVRYLAGLHAQWLHAARDRDALRASGIRTDGPLHLLRAMDLALVREMAARGGAEAWYAGMPTTDHPGAAMIRYYQARLQVNPELRGPRTSAAGILVARCIGCDVDRPLTLEHWELGERGWLPVCRACRRVDDATRQAFVAAIEADEAYTIPPADPLSAEMAEELR